MSASDPKRTLEHSAPLELIVVTERQQIGWSRPLRFVRLSDEPIRA